jgi:hypothetical protein
MAINLAQISATTTAATALSSLVLVSPQTVVGYQPQNPRNADGTPSQDQAPPAFLFEYEGEQSATLSSDITDHYVENNYAVQDQIALKPEMITTRGYIGELNDVGPRALQIAKAVAEKLTAISSYAPQVSITALVAYNEAFLAYQVATNAINAGVSAWSSVGNFLTDSTGQAVIDEAGLSQSSSPQNKQQIAFQQLYGYWRQRTLFTVQTPWAVFQNMAILSLRAIQGEETNVISDFEITFKMIRTANTAVGQPTSLSGRAATQNATSQNTGTSTPTSSIPLTTGLVQMGVA